MRNMGIVYKVQETRQKLLCKWDTVGWLVMVVSTCALVGRVWFQSHT